MRTGSILRIPKSKGTTYVSKSKAYYKGKGKKKRAIAELLPNSDNTAMYKKKKNLSPPTPSKRRKKKTVSKIDSSMMPNKTARELWKKIGW